MKSNALKKTWKPVLMVGGMAGLMIWSSGSCTAKVKPGVVETEPGIPVPADAPTFKAERAPAATRIEVIGTAASEERINLSARIPAQVKQVFVSAGTVVKAGQELVTLDDREVREQLVGAEAQLKHAETEFQRAKKLFESKATTEQALTAAESAAAGARAQVDRVKVMLTYARITSPIDGVVTDRRIEAGDLASPGQMLLAVYDPKRMRLEVPVPVRLIDRVTQGLELEVVFERPARAFKGRVSEIVSEIDPMSRTQLVKVRLDGVSGDVLPGAFGRVWAPGDERPAIFVPASAVYGVGQLEMVQVVRDGRALRRLVKTGPRHDGRVEILAGLDDGDVVLVQPGKGA